MDSSRIGLFISFKSREFILMGSTCILRWKALV
jgi:hypothetical protein